MFDLSQSKLWGILKWVKATLKEKLNRAQCSEPVKSKVPSIEFLWKSYDFLIIQEQK